MARQTIIQSPTQDSTPKEEPLIDSPPPPAQQKGITLVNGINLDVLTLAKTASEVERRASSDETIRVSTSLSFLAYFYEQVRNVIDNKSDHLLRRNAIERIFRRLIWENPKFSGAEIGPQLIKELVWSRYLSNNSITAEQTGKIIEIISKYSSIINRNSLFQNKNTNQQFALAVLSAEIEESIDPRIIISEKLSQTMETWFNSRYDWRDDEIPRQQKQLQLFVVLRKVLVKSDNARIAYQLIKRRIPNWDSLDEHEVKATLKTINDLFNAVRSSPDSPMFNPLYRLLTKHTAEFLILKDVFDSSPQDAQQIIQNKETLEAEIFQAAHLRYQQITKNITTGIIRSVFYILASKVLFVLLLEIPYELISAGHVNLLTLAVNLSLPPLLMLGVGLGIPRPDEKNTQILQQRVKDLVYPIPKEPRLLRLIPTGAKESWVFNTVYGLFVILVFTIIVTVLSLLRFNFVGILVFFIFLSLVLLFGFRVGFAATELYVEAPRKGILSRLFEQISLPFLNLGVILSKGLDRLNFLTIVMDILFEMPLKTLIDIVNRWSVFMGKKRAEIVEVPIQ